MTDSIQIPEEFWPEIDELPGEMCRLAKNIEEVVPGMGVRLVIHLIGKYGSTPIYFHNLQKFLLRARDRQIIKRYNSGERVVDIARDPDISLSSRQVWKILGREPGEDKQLKLF